MTATLSQPKTIPLYLSRGAANADGGDGVFCMLHMPSPDGERDTAVLICPPYGWEEICSHGSRRQWADHLATEGYRTLRFDLPSTGDSAGCEDDPALLEAWTEAVTLAVAHLRSEASRVTAIGIGLGGMVVASALAHGAEIDDVVLWGAAIRGRSLLREMRAFALLEDSGADAEQPPEDMRRESGAVAAGGFLLGGGDGPRTGTPRPHLHRPAEACSQARPAADERRNRNRFAPCQPPGSSGDRRDGRVRHGLRGDDDQATSCTRSD